MTKAATLEELVKKYLSGKTVQNEPDSYDIYKHKNGLASSKSYSDAVSSLYASSKRELSTYGANDRKISNKGLQNSGYAEYIDSLAKKSFESGESSLKASYADSEAKSRGSYASYLEKYQDKQASVKNSVMSHLINNDVVDLGTAVAYGLSAGLSHEDAVSVGQSAYEITKQRVFNNILRQTVSLGLDKDGAKALALKMGVSEEDASGFADEIDELLKYYGNISEEYLEYLEQRSN